MTVPIHTSFALIVAKSVSFLLYSMSRPGVWCPSDLDHILGDFGVFILERAGTDSDEAIAGLKQWEHNINYVPQVVLDENSSTKIRLLLKRKMSIEYLTTQNVIEYIEEHGLYHESSITVPAGNGACKA
jgi:nicotinamide mononucleotide adenylyltransferase